MRLFRIPRRRRVTFGGGSRDISASKSARCQSAWALNSNASQAFYVTLLELLHFVFADLCCRSIAHLTSREQKRFQLFVFHLYT